MITSSAGDGTDLLDIELEALAGASNVDTSLWEPSLRGDGPPTEEGFYVHRFDRYSTEDVGQAHLLRIAWYRDLEHSSVKPALIVLRDIGQQAARPVVFAVFSVHSWPP